MGDMNENLARFVDENGKIVISTEMPENLKSAIDYLNRNNVGLFDAIDDDYNDDLDADEEKELSENSNGVVDIDDGSVEEEDDDDDLLESESNSSNLNDLNSLF